MANEAKRRLNEMLQGVGDFLARELKVDDCWMTVAFNGRDSGGNGRLSRTFLRITVVRQGETLSLNGSFGKGRKRRTRPFVEEEWQHMNMICSQVARLFLGMERVDGCRKPQSWCDFLAGYPKKCSHLEEGERLRLLLLAALGVLYALGRRKERFVPFCLSGARLGLS